MILEKRLPYIGSLLSIRRDWSLIRSKLITLGPVGVLSRIISPYRGEKAVELVRNMYMEIYVGV